MTRTFLVYVETNWLVSYVLPHHDWRNAARALFNAAKQGECQLRIPKVAFLEARHVVDRATQDHFKAVNAISSSLTAAANNLSSPDLLDLAKKVKEAEASYRLPNPLRALNELIEQCQASGFGFHHPLEEQEELDRLRPQVAMRGPDITDLYILAAISAHRALNPGPPAAVLSANSAEFSDARGGSKLPPDFYASRKLVYNAAFNLEGAWEKWEKDSEKGWPLPVSPGQDPRVSEAQRILLKLHDNLRDAALEALKKLSFNT